MLPWPLLAPILTCPLPPSGLFRYMQSQAPCISLASADICTHMPTAPICLLLIPSLTCPLSSFVPSRPQHSLIFILPLFVLYRHLHSHAHCPPMVSAAICTYMSTTLLWFLLPSTLICPLPPSGLSRHLHSYSFCVSLASAGTGTHMPNLHLPMSSLGTCTHLLTVPSGLCRHLRSFAHCASGASANIYTHMTNALASALTCSLSLSGLCRHLHSNDQFA